MSARVVEPKDCEQRCRALGKCPIRVPLATARGEEVHMPCGFVVPSLRPRVSIEAPYRVPFAREPVAPWPELFECKTCGMWVMPDERHRAAQCAAFRAENNPVRRSA